MTTIRFPPGNKILYYQDFALKEGIPDGIDFDIEVLDADRVCLRAPGYGKEAPHYGNGVLRLHKGLLFYRPCTDKKG